MDVRSIQENNNLQKDINVSDRDDLVIEGNTGKIVLKHVNPKEKIGGDNVPIALCLERSEKTIRAFLLNTATGDILAEDKDIPFKGEEVYKRLINKKSLISESIFKDHLKDEPEDETKRKIRRLITESFKAFHSIPRDSIASTFHSDEGDIDFFNDEPTDDELYAIELLEDPNLFSIVDQELSRRIAGEEVTRRFTLIVYLQAFTKYFTNLTFQDPSSSGKSWLSNQVARIFPDEYILSARRLSRTVLERMQDQLKEVKIFIVSEAQGANSAMYSIRQSSSSDGLRQSKIYITNPNNSSEILEFDITGRCFVWTQTSKNLDEQDNTRTVIPEIDTSPQQTERVVVYQAHEAALPEWIRVLAKLQEPSIESVLKTAIRMLEKNVEIIVPFIDETELLKRLDKSKLRMRRDISKLSGAVAGIAWLYQKQRPTFIIDGRQVILSTVDDFKLAYDIVIKPFSNTYYHLDKTDRKILEIIKREYTTKIDGWVSESPEARRGLTTNDLRKAVQSKIKIGKTDLYDRLTNYRENSYVEYDLGEGGVGKTGYYYKPKDDISESIFAGNLTDELLEYLQKRFDERLKFYSSLASAWNVETLETSGNRWNENRESLE